MTGDQWIALTAVLSGALVGVDGLIFGYFNGRAERNHARNLSRGARLHEQRLAAYADLSAYLERERISIARIEPVFVVSEPQPPPDPLSADEWTQIMGRAAVAGSDEVRAAVEHARRQSGDFLGRAVVYRHMNAQHAEGQQLADAGVAMEQARQEAFGAIDAAQAQMRGELAELQDPPRRPAPVRRLEEPLAYTKQGGAEAPPADNPLALRLEEDGVGERPCRRTPRRTVRPTTRPYKSRGRRPPPGRFDPSLARWRPALLAASPREREKRASTKEIPPAGRTCAPRCAGFVKPKVWGERERVRLSRLVGFRAFSTRAAELDDRTGGEYAASTGSPSSSGSPARKSRQPFASELDGLPHS